MSTISIDIETKRKLREMGAAPLLDAIEGQDPTLTMGMDFGERLRLVVDEAHSTFNHAKIEGLIRRAGLRYPAARSWTESNGWATRRRARTCLVWPRRCAT